MDDGPLAQLLASRPLVPVVRGRDLAIPYDGPPAVLAAVARFGRSEAIRFSPSCRRVAVTNFSADRVCVLDVEVQRDANGAHVRLTGAVEITSPVLHSPHGVDFVDERRIVVANRHGEVVAFAVPDGTPDVERWELHPIARLGAAHDALVHDPGSVSVIGVQGDRCALLVCNNAGNTVTRHVLDLATGAVSGGHLSARKALVVPDGIAVARAGTAAAVSNHGRRTVHLFTAGLGDAAAPDPDADPDAVFVGLTYPHGICFGADDRYVFVADAGAPYVRVYERGDRWTGVRQPVMNVRVVDDELFRRGNHDAREGGPKGVDLDPGSAVVAITTELVPLTFLDASRLPLSGPA